MNKQAFNITDLAFTDFLKTNNLSDTDLIARLSQRILDYRKDSHKAFDKCLAFLYEIADTNYPEEAKQLKCIMVNPPAIMEAALHLSISQNKQMSVKAIAMLFVDTFIATAPEAMADYQVAFGDE